MRKRFYLIFLFCFKLSFIHAQDSCKCRLLGLKKIIQKSISVDEDHYSNNQSEFYIIDIKLNEKKDAISNVDLFKKNHSVHFGEIEGLIQQIKLNWHPNQCIYGRIIIPIFILFSSSDKLFDYPFELTKKNTNTYYFKEIVIQVHAKTK